MKKIFFVIALLIVLFLCGSFWWNNGLSPVNSQSNEYVDFVVKKGSGLKEISSNLQQAGLIKSRIVFFLYTRLKSYENKIQAGNFRLSTAMTAEEIAQNLTHGTLDVRVTIPEGQRATEIAETLKEKIPAYDFTWINALVANEGYLFPDTYLIPRNANIDAIMAQMKNNFSQKYDQINTNNLQLTKSQIVILASLIEREAITDEEKPIIAGILLNRLNAGMPLQVDATIQYAKGKNASSNKWWEPVALEEYQSVKSDYNTYLRTGFPPTPISNPGLEALKAAANPTDTDYLFYIHDRNGNIHYAKTLNEHNANIEKYGV